jgi:hypothetical protein
MHRSGATYPSESELLEDLCACGLEVIHLERPSGAPYVIVLARR